MGTCTQVRRPRVRVTGCQRRVTNKPGDSGKGVQFLNMSHSSFSMGVLPMVRRKKSSSTRSEEMKRSAGRSSSSLPNLGDGVVAMGGCPTLVSPVRTMGTAVPDGLPRVVGTVVLAQHHLGLVLQVLHLLRVLQATGLCGDKGVTSWGGVQGWPVVGAGGGLTWFEEHHSLHAGKFCGVNGQCLEAAKRLLQRPHIQGGRQQLPRGRLRDSQEWAALQGHGPLDGTEQEQLTPCFLQQDHLGRAGGNPKTPVTPRVSRTCSHHSWLG